MERWDDWLVHHTKAALIWDTDSFTARKSFHRGQLTDGMVMANLTTFNSRVQRKGDNLYWNTDPKLPEPTHTCVECSQIGATVECTTHPAHTGSSGFAHATCFILQHQHICTQCLSIERQSVVSFAVCKLAANPSNYTIYSPTWNTYTQTTMYFPYYVTV